MKTWIVPGCPREDGWDIWYAYPKTASGFVPGDVEVFLGDQAIDVVQTRRILDPLPAFDRRIVIVSVRLPQPMPGKTFTVRFPELEGTNRRAPLMWQTRPAEIDAAGLRFFFGSCFWWNDDKDGHFQKAVEAVIRCEKPARPAFKFLAGDQIYLDYPIPLNPLNTPAEKVAARYNQYWGDDNYREMMLATPNFFLGDDHEWWNDYPEPQMHLPHTWRESTRADYAQVASSYFDSFQASLNPGGRHYYQFEIPPVSFFVADTRSLRERVGDNDMGQHFMSADQWEALEQWQQELQGPGILVTGMPLLEKLGDWKDHTLKNFSDYSRLLDLFSRSLEGDNLEGVPHDIVILTGDIHTARHCRATLWGRDDLHVHELVASPASRVGPFLSEPDPSQAPKHIVRPNGTRWANVSTYPDSVSVENNLGLIRLFPSQKQNYRVRLEFVSYQVRPHRRPAWKLGFGGANSTAFKLYEKAINLK